MVFRRILVLQPLHAVHVGCFRVHGRVAGELTYSNVSECHSDGFGCTQRLRTLTEFRTMSIAPYPIQCKREGKWLTIQTDELLPGDIVSVGMFGFHYCSYKSS